jgi:hypothetical protein
MTDASRPGRPDHSEQAHGAERADDTGDVELVEDRLGYDTVESNPPEPFPAHKPAGLQGDRHVVAASEVHSSPEPAEHGTAPPDRGRQTGTDDRDHTELPPSDEPVHAAELEEDLRDYDEAPTGGKDAPTVEVGERLAGGEPLSAPADAERETPEHPLADDPQRAGRSVGPDGSDADAVDIAVRPDGPDGAVRPDGPDGAVRIAEPTEEDHPASDDAPDRSRGTEEALSDGTAVQAPDDPPDRARPLSGAGTDPADLASTHQQRDDLSPAGGIHLLEADDPPAGSSPAAPLADAQSIREGPRLADTTAEPTEIPSGPRPDPPRATGSPVDGPLDWTTWTAQVREKLGGPDLERRLQLAREDDATLAELQTAVRYADAGYKVELLVPLENKGVKNPDLKVQYAGKDATWVEVKHRVDGSMTKNFLDDVVKAANEQIRGARKEIADRGHIVIDASTAPGLMSPVDVERFLNGKMTNTDSTSPQLLRIDYLEVLYRDPGNGHLMRSSMTRGADGRTAPVVTEDCEERR